jgi:cation diffusion facilitator CzcD-associated flavoprotein CzcO
LIDTEGTDVTVFQRTPQWIVKVKDRVFTEEDKARFRKQPWRMKLIRELSLLSYRQNTSAITGDSFIDRIKHRMMARLARKNLENSVEDPILREKLTPDYKFGCKRVVINATFYPAMQKPNAHLVTEGIERFEHDGIVTCDGQRHPFDVIVLATGFNPAAYMRPMEFLGNDGISIEQAWARKIQAYRSILLPGFPNFFLMLGPNSPIGNYSVICMAELQTDYAIKLVDAWREGKLQTIEAKTEAMQEWNSMLKGKMGKTAWASGCQSWYLDADGDPLSWPDNWSNWVAQMATPDLRDFLTTAPTMSSDNDSITGSKAQRKRAA